MSKYIVENGEKPVYRKDHIRKTTEAEKHSGNLR